MSLTVYRKSHFNAAHRLYRSDWDDEKNNAVFGKCNNPNFHGHNYELEVGVTGTINQETGFLIDIVELKNIIKEEVEDYLDHKNLNLDVPEFKNLNPTMENIAVLIWDKLNAKLLGRFKLSVTLYETPRNFVVYTGN
ncbi:MAG: 6-carboxytetrahydropterin synthase [Flavobacteriaceae bacterium]|jgi:6-pyruvoyltetrahydropterin/6-carboxytetrahydropterin synthase|nr:6-carboxytetrahydropterin synthase [Flavobacteriaceae bacterium]MBT3919167.1 6-carboxytetrahydropterin synthase [Flavobacteriaceae bacterium]MBT6704391.1 6-carboxytetrahydropterin synthase [Flavobacteriaceae bacterium]|tara:strand:+ start:1903 stop:2313 length:411 start_codon:yes stop_codon:yes gene_type:complete